MRLVTWNCNEGFDRKFLHLRDLNFDIAVVTECGPLESGLDEASREVSAVLKLAVDQPGHTKHIGVFAQKPWHVEPLPLVPGQPLGPAGARDRSGRLTVLAVWALGREWVADRLSYAAQTARVVADLLPEFDGPVVPAGDLNAPIASSPADARRHEESARQLANRGLVSAFTAARGKVDPLTEPTLYHQRKFDRPFHIDHLFVPKEWTGDMEVTVGTYAEWIATRRSGHVPVIADVTMPGLESPAGI